MSVHNINGDRIDEGGVNLGIGNLADYGDLSTAQGFLRAFNLAMADQNINGISIPFGTYNVANPLQITRDTFDVDGNGCTLNMRDDNGTPANQNCFLINGKSRINIRNFIINMRQNANSTSGTAFYFLDANYVTVENIDVFSIGCRGALIYNTDETSSTPGCKKIFFKNVKLRGINAQNNTLDEWPCGIIAVNLIDSGFEDCVVSGMGRFTLEFKNYSKNCYMKNNVIYGSSFEYEYESGIALGGDRPDSESVLGDGLVMIGNVVRNCKYPLYVGRLHNSVISNNIFEGQFFMHASQACVVTGNVMKSTSKYDIPLIQIGWSDNILLSDNIYDPGSNNLFYIPASNTNTLVNGFMNGREIHVLNPTSGTPAS